MRSGPCMLLLCSACLQPPPSDDADMDGWPSAQDCDDGDATIHPEAEEVWYDGIDQDCAGDSDYDQDGDGHDAEAHGGDDCDDERVDTHTGADEIWYDGVDNACDGGDDYDQDGDGYPGDGGGDCDDTDPEVHPDALDIANGLDDDCDGEADEKPWQEGEDEIDVTTRHGGLTGEGGAYLGLGSCISPRAADAVPEHVEGDQLQFFPDGRQDLLVSAPMAAMGGVTGYQNAVYAVPGGDFTGVQQEKISERALLRIVSDQYDWFGFDVAWLPDVDQDGQYEILVGTVGSNIVMLGAAYIYLSSDLADAEPSATSNYFDLPHDEASVIIQAAERGDYSGRTVALNDIDQDGLGDFAICAPLAGGGTGDGAVPGAICIFSGASLSSLSSEPGYDQADYTVVGNGTDYQYVGDIAPAAADLDGDGNDELFVASHESGAYGLLAIWEGDQFQDPAPSRAIQTLDSLIWGSSDNIFNRPILRVGGDLDGDGHHDLALSGLEPTGAHTALLLSGGLVLSNPGAEVEDVLMARVSGLGLPVWKGSDEEFPHFPISIEGDIDDDGHSELVVGNCIEELHAGGGAVGVWYGAPAFSGTHGMSDAYPLLVGQADYELGYLAAEAQDITGDGFADLLLGAAGFDGQGDPQGALFVLDPIYSW